MAKAPSQSKLKPLLTKARKQGWSKWIRSEHDERAMLNGYVFHEPTADYVVNFIESYCRHSKGKWSGQPFTLLDWQKDDLIKPIFGWLDNNGHRRIRQAYCEVPKKNGKSTLGSGVGIYMLCGDGEPGAEVYAAATRRDQAKIVFSEAVRMVRKSPQLSRYLKPIESTNRIVYAKNESYWEVLAYDGKAAEGKNIHCVIIDELHVWRSREFWDSLRWGGAARTQPLHFAITTAGISDNSALGWEEHGHAMDYIEGKIHDDRYYAMVYAASEDDDILDPATHEKANPSYGVTIDSDEMEHAAIRASERASELGPFLRYRLNVWTKTFDSFFDMRAWSACGSKAINEQSLIGRTCYAGLDMANKIDIAAWVLVFPPREEEGEEDWMVLPRFFVPEDTADRRESEDGVKYATWGREGYIKLTPGNVIDYNAVMGQIALDTQQFEVLSVGADPWNLEYMRQTLANFIPNLELFEFGQTTRFMSEPTKKLEALILEGKVQHAGNPVLTWMAGNAVPREDHNGNIRVDKKESRDKVDGIVALVMAIGRAMVPEAQSVYNERGLIII